MRRKAKPVNTLLDAVEFISLAQERKGSEMQTHCIVSGKTIVAFDGVLAAGHLIEEDLEACPQTEPLRLALARCGPEFAITQLSPDRLQIRSGDFVAFVPCAERDKLPQVNPDAPAAALTDSLTGALRLALPFVNDKADKLELASISIHQTSLLATNGGVLIEAWHGCNLPDGFLLPKAVAKAVVNSGKKLVSLGYSGTTVTFWFEDNSWIRTQLFPGVWPENVWKIVLEVFQAQSNPRAIPPEFADAVKQVLPFADGERIHCGSDTVSSHATSLQSGGHLTLQVEGGLQNRVYHAKNLLAVCKIAQSADENALEKATLFFGENLRGAIVHTKPIAQQPALNDDISF